MASYSIGVDLGGTNLRAAAIDSAGNILGRADGVTGLAAGREAVIADIVAGILKLRASGGAAGLAGIGIGVPGFLNIEKGIVRLAPNLPGFENFPMRDEIERLLDAPVLLENDANAAALGEKWMGAGQGVDDLVLLTLGTGVGGGIISEGRVIHGFVGMAGELGHLTVVPNGFPCACGNTGCLEKHASATAVTCMAKMMGLGDNLSSKHVYDLAMGGNERAHTIFRSFGASLGMALASLINIFNFPLYLLSGGVLGAWDLFAPSMFDQVKARSLTFRSTATRIEKARLGNEAGLYGAAWLPFMNAAARPAAPQAGPRASGDEGSAG